MSKMTHTGIIKGNDNRTSPDYKYKVKLRETTNFWITEKGTKYRKRSGFPLGKWPVERLDLETVKEITNV